MKSIESLGEFMNLPELLDRVENDQELLGELFALFQEDLPASQGALQMAVDENDLREVERTAHRLKGMLANLSAKHTASQAAEIEFTARTGNAAKIRELMSTFVPQMSALSAALDSLMTSA